MSERRQAIIISTGMDNTKLQSSIRGLVGYAKEAGEQIKRGFMPANMQNDVANYYRRAGKAAGTAFKEGQMAGLGIAGAAVAGAAMGVVRIGDSAKRTQEEAGNAGFDTRSYELLLEKVRMSAGDTEQASAALAMLNKNIGEAQAGVQGAVAKFDRWGISLNDSNGKAKTAQQILGDIADKLNQTDSGATRAAMKFELLGRGYKGFADVLNGGSKDLNSLPGVMRAMAPTDTELSAWRGLADSVKALWEGAKGLGIRAGGSILKFTPWGAVGAEEAMLEKFHREPDVAEDPEVKAAVAVVDNKKEAAEIDRRNREQLKELEQSWNHQMEHEKAVTEEKEKQARMNREAANDVIRLGELSRQQRSQMEAGTFLTLEQLAGRSFTSRLESQYGTGGTYDLGRGNNPFSRDAQELERLKYATQFDRLHGNTAQVGKDIDRMTQLKQGLIAAGVLPDDLSIKKVADETAKTSAHLATLVSLGADPSKGLNVVIASQ